MKLKRSFFTMVLSMAIVTSQGVMSASHSDAPLIKQDPQANLTDVYAFVGTAYDDPSQQVLNVIVAVRPFSEPGDGVIYDRFADDALYSIHITDPNTGQTNLRYDFRFSSVTEGYKNLNTILSYGLGTEAGAIVDVDDARQNYTQTYSVIRTKGSNVQVIADGNLTPPPNVGLRTTPAYNDPVSGLAVSGATSIDGLDAYTQQTLYRAGTGEGLFAGPREDGFYADTPAIFDLLDPRILDNNDDLGDGLGQDGNGVDGFKGFNVLTYAVQIPLSELTPSPFTAAFADLGNASNPIPSVASANGVGVFASVSRQRIRLLNSGGAPRFSGPWVQVNRMGNPLFNEVLVPLVDKDAYNRANPVNDADFSAYAENPEIAFLINFVYGTAFEDSGRGDLALVYIPDVLRVDTTTGPVTLAGEADYHRLGALGGDIAIASDGKVKSAGWPNGRRLGDDVVDIALTVVANGPSFQSLDPVGDNMDANDQVYHQVFPYAATPHAGPTNRKDP
ncbi:MAG: DUF4331 domain-containing protein [Gammaproteobacteria bacterium]|nr:DUF4331 domain-containing protein [Gammaproteobacteria bacterium]